MDIKLAVCKLGGERIPPRCAHLRLEGLVLVGEVHEAGSLLVHGECFFECPDLIRLLLHHHLHFPHLALHLCYLLLVLLSILRDSLNNCIQLLNLTVSLLS